MKMEMEIDIERQAETLTLKLIGRLDTKTALELQDVIDKEVVNVSLLIIDMTEMDYVTSAGLRVLLKTTKMMDGSGGHMEIQHANNPEVMQVFNITGFSNILDIKC